MLTKWTKCKFKIVSAKFVEKLNLMSGILSYFLPKDKVFYSLFEEASDNLQEIAKKLVQVVYEPDYNKRGVLIKEIQDLKQDVAQLKEQISSANK
jgi:CHASE3 domain sensor protein